MLFKKNSFLMLLIVFVSSALFGYKNLYIPDITIVFVVDQLGYSYLSKYRPYLKFGLKKLMNQGVFFHNALYPHAMPTTPTGHAAIATGAFANMHGFNSYGFVDSENKFVEITEDNSDKSLEFTIDGKLRKTGQSPKYLMADTVADQFVLASKYSKQEVQAEAASFALKPRAGIPLAGCGNLAKAFWFSEEDGAMTTSKFYFDKMPDWLKNFNARNQIKDGTCFVWKPFYKPSSDCYAFAEAQNYSYSAVNQEKSPTKKIKIDYSNSKNFETFKRSPFSSQLLFAAAKAYIRKKTNKKLLVYVSLSNFDYSGHLLGPDNFDQIDLLYHLDWQIGKMISFVERLYGAKKSLFVFTADHGISPIPEILNKQGLKAAERIDGKLLLEKVNSEVEKEFGYRNIVQHFEAPQLYLDRKVLDRLSDVKKNQLYQKIKEVLLSENGILYAWSDIDLEKGDTGYDLEEIRSMFAKQYVKGRSGNIVYLTYPNKMVSMYPKGTSHCTPYRYDRHVPLIFYQRLRVEKREVWEAVSMLSLAATQSYLMGIIPPSCASTKYLPGISLD